MANNRYSQIIERIFLARHEPGSDEVEFEREDLEGAAAELNVKLPKNLGDLIYSFRYRVELPQSIQDRAPAGKAWIIRPAGRSRYRFVAVNDAIIRPDPMLAKIKIPDATPGIIAAYSLSDEQALLAKVRYNRLIDIFTGITCYALQSHLRTTVAGMGQLETDELYVGIDSKGGQYVLPVQAKGGSDQLSPVQIEQDIALCAKKFPTLTCKPIGAQFMDDRTIALFLFIDSEEGVRIAEQKHYALVAPDEISPEELATYVG